jgi:hypothetical protein
VHLLDFNKRILILKMHGANIKKTLLLFGIRNFTSMEGSLSWKSGGRSFSRNSKVHCRVHNGPTMITKMTNKMQLCRLIYCSLTALHVSSDIFAHHQEHLNCIYSFWHYSRMSLPSGVMTPDDSDIRV